jgi:hypothetical protein
MVSLTRSTDAPRRTSPLLAQQPEVLIADMALDAEKQIIAPLAATGQVVVFPERSNRSPLETYDHGRHKACNLIRYPTRHQPRLA